MLKIEYVNIDDVYLNDENVNIHSTKSIEKIAKSIKEYGFLNPIIVDKNNIAIAGNGRLEASKMLGLKKIPIIRAEHLTEAQLKAYAIADNRIAEESFFDNNLLQEVLKELELENFDLELTGFDKEEIDKLLDFDDEDNLKVDSDNESVDEQELAHKCPKCGFEFDD